MNKLPCCFLTICTHKKLKKAPLFNVLGEIIVQPEDNIKTYLFRINYVNFVTLASFFWNLSDLSIDQKPELLINIIAYLYFSTSLISSIMCFFM